MITKGCQVQGNLNAAGLPLQASMVAINRRVSHARLDGRACHPCRTFSSPRPKAVTFVRSESDCPKNLNHVTSVLSKLDFRVAVVVTYEHWRTSRQWHPTPLTLFRTPCRKTVSVGDSRRKSIPVGRQFRLEAGNRPPLGEDLRKDSSQKQPVLSEFSQPLTNQ